MRTNHKKRFLNTLSKLMEDYPTQTIGAHLSFIFDGYPRLEDVEGLPDKEILYLTEKYKCEKDLDFCPIHEDSEIDKIVNEGLDLDHILDEEEDSEEI